MIDKDDQLCKILKRLPALNKFDYGFVSDLKSIDYLSEIRHRVNNSQKSLASIFSDFDVELVRILESMLQFNPYLRPSAG